MGGGGAGKSGPPDGFGGKGKDFGKGKGKGFGKGKGKPEVCRPPQPIDFWFGFGFWDVSRCGPSTVGRGLISGFRDGSVVWGGG